MFKLLEYNNTLLCVSLPPGFDVAGEVTSVGSAVTKFKPGDAVFGAANAMVRLSGQFHLWAYEDLSILRLPQLFFCYKV